MEIIDSFFMLFMNKKNDTKRTQKNIEWKNRFFFYVAVAVESGRFRL